MHPNHAGVNAGRRSDPPHARPAGPHPGTTGIDPRAVVLPWGKHRGRRLGDLPFDYLVWVADNSESPTWAALARRAIGLLDESDDDTEPSPELASVVLPGVTYRWYTAMLDRYADDPLAREVVGHGLDVLQALCTRYTHKPWVGGEAA